MSMVVFKIIVQKTVDKVLGSLKPHHIRNSRVKINRYIKLSQSKLTNVVMGRPLHHWSIYSVTIQYSGLSSPGSSVCGAVSHNLRPYQQLYGLSS